VSSSNSSPGAKQQISEANELPPRESEISEDHFRSRYCLTLEKTSKFGVSIWDSLFLFIYGSHDVGESRQ
jgi:hypothetical protein